MSKDKKEYVDVDAAASRKDYAQVLTTITEHGGCPYCADFRHPVETFKYHTNPILWSGAYWLATDNFARYTGAKYQFLIPHREHIEHILEISPQAWAELHIVISWLCREYNIPGGSFFMRFGDMNYNGASVAHLHAQLLMGSPKQEGKFMIAPPLGFSTKEYIPPPKK